MNVPKILRKQDSLSASPLKINADKILTHCTMCYFNNLFISIRISGYFYWYSKKDVTHFKFGTRTQTTIW